MNILYYDKIALVLVANFKNNILNILTKYIKQNPKYIINYIIKNY